MVKQYWKSQRGASSLGSGNSSSVTLLFGQAVQSIHTLAALSEYLPDAQFSHMDAPTFENVLASQSVHDDAASRHGGFHVDMKFFACQHAIFSEHACLKKNAC